MRRADQRQLDAIANHFRDRRDELLQAWRLRVKADPECAIPAGLSRAALDDHIPTILRNFERRLRSESSVRATEVELEQRQNAAEHAVHRWERGYDVREMTCEWAHLLELLSSEIDAYGIEHPEAERETLAAAREIVVSLNMKGIAESVARFVRLLQQDAADRARSLSESLQTLQTLENERATLLSQTAHDLKGSVGVIANASALLCRQEIDESRRTQFHELLRRGVHSTGTLLNSLMELSRLESGQDQPRFKVFDAARAIGESCDVVRALAEQRGLFLRCQGQAPFTVEGDATMLQRILQNLLLNALEATTTEGITVQWQPTSEHAWQLTVADTGRGFDPREFSARAQSSGSAGHGIGLTVVKRLCEALRAHMDIDGAAGGGTRFRITFPRRYLPSP
jgi:signal transduction histidine kinase